MVAITKKNKLKRAKLCLVCSPGGHFYQMQQLNGWWSKYPHFWVTGATPDIRDKLRKEKVYYGYFPENRHAINAIRNLLLAILVLRKERPSMIFTTGAGISPPFFLIGKLLKIKLVFLETASYVGIATLSGKLVYGFSDVFLIQHESSKKFYPKAKFKGGLI